MECPVDNHQCTLITWELNGRTVFVDMVKIGQEMYSLCMENTSSEEEIYTVADENGFVIMSYNVVIAGDFLKICIHSSLTHVYVYVFCLCFDENQNLFYL